MTYANIDTDRIHGPDPTEGLHVNLSIKDNGELRLSIPASQQDAFGLTEELFALIERPRIRFLAFEEDARVLRFSIVTQGGNALTNSKGPEAVRYGVETRVDVPGNTCLMNLSKDKRAFEPFAVTKVAPLTFEVVVPADMLEERDDLFTNVHPIAPRAADGVLDVYDAGEKTFMSLPDELISKLRALYADKDQLRIMKNGNVVSPRTVDVSGEDSINMQFKSAKRFRSLGFDAGRYEYKLTFVSTVCWALTLTQVS